MKKTYIIIATLFIYLNIFPQMKYSEIESLFSKGEFTKAEKLIETVIGDPNNSAIDKIYYSDKIEVMRRIKLDFKKSEADILNSFKKYYPDITSALLRKWEKENTLEMMVIDGERRYFNNSVPNFFRMNKTEMKVKERVDGAQVNKLDIFLEKELPETMTDINTGNNKNKVTFKINYKMTLKADVVPAGEIIRCWMPFPRGDVRRQNNLKFISINGENQIFSGDKYAHSSVYFEKKTVKGEPTVFEMNFESTSSSEFNFMMQKEIKPYDLNSEVYIENTKEFAPHIIFNDEIKKLALSIIGKEENPYQKVKLICEWIDKNIPWTSAREYSTIENIPLYCIRNMRGDCGIKALLFITLSRVSGVPARWQSGWMMHPGSLNLHDWAEAYFEGIGWVPVDPDFGIQEFGDENIKYFYTNGIDAYRLYINNDIQQPFYPAKSFFRSEPYDFQRGELEWRGGNLYFDKWSYDMEVEYIK